VSYVPWCEFKPHSWHCSCTITWLARPLAFWMSSKFCESDTRLLQKFHITLHSIVLVTLGSTPLYIADRLLNASNLNDFNILQWLHPFVITFSLCTNHVMYVEITVVSVLALPGKQLRPLLLMIDTTDFSSVDGWIDITTACYQLLLINTILIQLGL